MFDIRNQQCKEQHIQGKYAYIRLRHKKKNASNTQKRKQNHHQFMHNPLMLKKSNMRPHRQKKLFRDRSPCRDDVQKSPLVITHFFQHSRLLDKSSDSHGI